MVPDRRPGIKISGSLILLLAAALAISTAASAAEFTAGGALRPETTIAKHPPVRTSSQKARFTFSSDKFSADFECKLDHHLFRVCRSPFRAEVKPGRHSFQVRARVAGGADLTPAVFRWRVS